MAKQFTKVTQTYSTKNKLQLLILTELLDIDCSLFPDKGLASHTIKTLYNNALSAYKGNAAIPPLKIFEANKNNIVYYVEDVINISMYNVEIDISCQQ